MMISLYVRIGYVRIDEKLWNLRNMEHAMCDVQCVPMCCGDMRNAKCLECEMLAGSWSAKKIPINICSLFLVKCNDDDDDNNNNKINNHQPAMRLLPGLLLTFLPLIFCLSFPA